jgi:hypothetical protein
VRASVPTLRGQSFHGDQIKRMNYPHQTIEGHDGSSVLHCGETSTAPHLGRFQPGRFVQPKEQDTTNSFLDATGPLHPHRNRCAVTGGAPRHLLVYVTYADGTVLTYSFHRNIRIADLSAFLSRAGQVRKVAL